MKVLITGGSRGIGAACVRAFSQRGDSVAFLYHTSHEQATVLAKETGAIALSADVSDAAAATAATKKAIERLGGIRCGFKSTSCPDQLANALREYLTKK